MQYLFGIILLSLGLSACSGLHRSLGSGYENYQYQVNGLDQFYQERKAYRQDRARSEIGLSQNQQLSETNRIRLRQRIRVQKLEDQIPSEKELRQYYALKPLMRSDMEKIKFLSLPSFEVKQKWANRRRIGKRLTKVKPHVTKAIENKDIILGMSKKSVIESWGEPDLVEVAGNHIYENERWSYKRLITAAEGFKHEVRVIFFEYGNVAGWEKH